MKLVFFLIFTNFSLMAGTLPPIFTASVEAQREFCQTHSQEGAEFWSKLMASAIDQEVQDLPLSGLDQEVYKNHLVTLSYLELMDSQDPAVKSMSYVYAQASNHLGRLVRFHYWDKWKETELSEFDHSLINGTILGSTVRYFPKVLSTKLMKYSLDLYKVLSTHLAARSLCQKSFREEFDTLDVVLFVNNFVSFEQSYLQETMYADPVVKIPAAAGVLDKMRFIPFEGKKEKSFYDWCWDTQCGVSSLKLEKRVAFDQEVIQEELKRQDHQERLLSSRILEITEHVQTHLSGED